MIIFEKNSFNKKDIIINSGFGISLFLLVMVFLYIPIFINLFLGSINTVVCVLLPSLVIIPLLCVSMYFVRKKGNVLSKLKLVGFRVNHIYAAFSAAIVMLFIMGNLMQIYLQLLTALGIEPERPQIEEIIRNSSYGTLMWVGLGIVVLAPISEELVFRRFIFGFLAPRCGFILALIISSGIFAAIHLSLYSLPALFLLGIGFQLIYLKFGSLYPAILMHAFNNAFALSLLLLFPEIKV